MAGVERIRSVAARVKREAESGNQVLVVVRAMAGETDRLVQLCKEASALADPKEYDVVVASGEQVTAGLLAMTLQNMGVTARSFLDRRALERAREAGIRVVHPRLGVVLGDGGVLARLLPVFRLCLGGRLGSGMQWMSWIARDDLVRALPFLAEHDAVAGPVNVVAPEPVRNADFTRTLARVLRRPAPWVVPGFVLELLYGQMARETLLHGQRVRCGRLCEAGFPFAHPTLEGALRVAVGDDG